MYKYNVETRPAKLGPFIATLKTLRPSLGNGTDVAEWIDTAVRSFMAQPGSRREFIQDAQDFVVGSMLYNEDTADTRDKARISAQVAHKLLKEYLAYTMPWASADGENSMNCQNGAKRQLQDMLSAFGQKQPKVCVMASLHAGH